MYKQIIWFKTILSFLYKSFILWPLTVLLQGDDILYPDNDGGDTANVDLEPREVDEDNDNQSASG